MPDFFVDFPQWDPDTPDWLVKILKYFLLFSAMFCSTYCVLKSTVGPCTSKTVELLCNLESTVLDSS